MSSVVLFSGGIHIHTGVLQSGIVSTALYVHSHISIDQFYVIILNISHFGSFTAQFVVLFSVFHCVRKPLINFFFVLELK